MVVSHWKNVQDKHHSFNSLSYIEHSFKLKLKGCIFMKNELKIFENEAFGKVRVIEKTMSRGL